MFSKAVFKRTFKSNAKQWIGITVALLLLLIITFVLSTSMKKSGAVMVDQFFTMFAPLLFLIYIAMTGNKLIAAQVDNGALSCTLSGKVKRTEFSITQGIFLFGSIIASYVLLTVVGLIIGAALEGFGYTSGQLVVLMLGSMLLNLAVCGISYCASCVFNTSSRSLLVGAGLPVLFLVIQKVADFGLLADNAAITNLKYLSLYTLFDIPSATSYSLNLVWQFPIMFAIAAAGFIVGNIIFKKKDLPL